MDAIDVRHATQWLAAELRARPSDEYDYDQRAHGLEWSCWEAVEHVLDRLFAYALQVAGRAQSGFMPVVGADGREDLLVRSARAAGSEGLAANLEAMGEMLAAVVEATPEADRAWHPYGESDAAGFAAMGTGEALIHGWDVLTALDDEAAELPLELCADVLARLFPGSPTEEGTAQDVLLWQTGREEIGGLGRLTSWRWDPTAR